ncbi:hypothetical protein GCM10018781_56100 [Kitasatospora indigofera]|uniref:Uncharacterized protein n=1 Tax=Kitasatospora indigofera TaxID=67307 RepID=A0A919G6P2_9ACTN|nr:hypothetical protein GCM10018781_56100 [Kitasatospora indigofera]
MRAVTGRHRRPAEPQPPAHLAVVRSATDGQPVVEEGVVVFPGSTIPYAYRTVHQPDGRCDRYVVRLDPPPPEVPS